MGSLVELTESEVTDRLAVNSPELVAEMFQLLRGLVERETEIEARIDAKAAGLVGVAGLSSTVAFAVLGHTDAFTRFQHRIAIVVVFIAGELFGLAAAGLAGWSMKMQKRVSVTGHALFDEALLAKANKPPGIDVDRRTMDDQIRAFGLMEYRKALIPHLWTILRDLRRVHQAKATLVEIAQWLFFGFLGACFVVSIIAVAGTLL